MPISKITKNQAFWPSYKHCKPCSKPFSSHYPGLLQPPAILRHADDYALAYTNTIYNLLLTFSSLVLFIHSSFFNFYTLSQSTFALFISSFPYIVAGRPHLSYTPSFVSSITSKNHSSNHAILTRHHCIASSLCCCQPNLTASCCWYVLLRSLLRSKLKRWHSGIENLGMQT